MPPGRTGWAIPRKIASMTCIPTFQWHIVVELSRKTPPKEPFSLPPPPATCRGSFILRRFRFLPPGKAHFLRERPDSRFRGPNSARRIPLLSASARVPTPDLLAVDLPGPFPCRPSPRRGHIGSSDQPTFPPRHSPGGWTSRSVLHSPPFQIGPRGLHCEQHRPDAGHGHQDGWQALSHHRN